MSSPPVAHAESAVQPRLQFNADWILRPLFGFVLAGLALAATISGGLWFVLFISLGCAGAQRGRPPQV